MFAQQLYNWNENVYELSNKGAHCKGFDKKWAKFWPHLPHFFINVWLCTWVVTSKKEKSIEMTAFFWPGVNPI